MDLHEFIAPCHFSLEAVLKREILDLGYEITKVEDGRVAFAGDAAAAAYANVFLRTTERILLKVGQFKAVTFEELFEKTKALPWENYLPKDAKFDIVKANSVKSRLYSPSDVQSIMKKAIVERLKPKYHKEWFSQDGAPFPVRVSILKDEVTIGLDTTGTSLHKRGYRLKGVKAPISETLAAAIIMLTPWKKDRILVDPFCGSGTFAVEAAMIASDMAPGMKRNFLAEGWENLIPRKCWADAKEEAAYRLNTGIKTDIQGYDIDPLAVKRARENAELAGVGHLVHLQERDVKDLSHSGRYGFIVTNPPYGERLEKDGGVSDIYKTLGERFSRLDTWSMYMITAYKDAQKMIGKMADKNRKLYNGMIKTYLYQYIGPKPPKTKAPAEY